MTHPEWLNPQMGTPEPEYVRDLRAEVERLRAEIEAIKAAAVRGQPCSCPACYAAGVSESCDPS